MAPPMKLERLAFAAWSYDLFVKPRCLREAWDRRGDVLGGNERMVFQEEVMKHILLNAMIRYLWISQSGQVFGGSIRSICSGAPIRDIDVLCIRPHDIVLTGFLRYVASEIPQAGLQIMQRDRGGYSTRVALQVENNAELHIDFAHVDFPTGFAPVTLGSCLTIPRPGEIQIRAQLEALFTRDTLTSLLAMLRAGQDVKCPIEHAARNNAFAEYYWHRIDAQSQDFHLLNGTCADPPRPPSD